MSLCFCLISSVCNKTPTIYNCKIYTRKTCVTIGRTVAYNDNIIRSVLRKLLIRHIYVVMYGAELYFRNINLLLSGIFDADKKRLRHIGKLSVIQKVSTCMM